MTYSSKKVLGPMDILALLESNGVLELLANTDSRRKH
jgi:hypothetical protein